MGRFIALGELARGAAAPKDKTKKWVHALKVEAIAYMKKEDLAKRTPDTTDCPYVTRTALGGTGGRDVGGGSHGGAQVREGDDFYKVPRGNRGSSMSVSMPIVSRGARLWHARSRGHFVLLLNFTANTTCLLLVLFCTVIYCTAMHCMVLVQ